MMTRIGRLWQARRNRAAMRVASDEAGRSTVDTTADMPSSSMDGLAQPDPSRSSDGLPEQPVLLAPSGEARPVHVGELLPARQRRWPLAVAWLPAVPKRAILAAGVCAGLAAPSLARHLATRLLFGPVATRPEGVMEITRIVYSGPMTPRAAAAIGKVLASGRR